MIHGLRIFPRLMAAFGVLLVGCILVASLGAMALRDVQARASMLGTDIFERAEALSVLERAMAARELAVRDLASQDDVTVVMDEIKRFKASRTKLNAIDAALAAQVEGDADALALIARLDKVRAEQQKVVEAVLNHALTGNSAEASRSAREGLLPLLDQSGKVLDELHTLFNHRAKDEVAKVQAKAERATLVMLAVTALLTLAGGVLAWTMAMSVSRPLGTAIATAEAIAAGDLTQGIRVEGSDEASDMLRALRDMQQSLLKLVGEVRSGVQAVSTASDEIAVGNLDLSHRTEEQASALQQTAATMEELGSTVRNNADNAKQASQLAIGASSLAQQGGEVVGKVVSTMQGISSSSRKIGDIIGVIDGIAFQTNILALNAAVEAARAGEQGRGFAVVASEVRSLAQRSAEAAKEIKGMIGRSVEQVEQGTLLVDQAGQTMGEIVGSIQRVSDIVAEISSASVEQSSGVQQVGEAVSQMDHVTQQNAALVEESAAAAESLKNQARQLVGAVAAFKL